MQYERAIGPLSAREWRRVANEMVGAITHGYLRALPTLYAHYFSHRQPSYSYASGHLLNPTEQPLQPSYPAYLPQSLLRTVGEACHLS